MSNKCSTSGCHLEASGICTCTNENNYFCANHIGQHFLKHTAKPHNLISLLTLLPSDQIAKTSTKVKGFLTHLAKLKAETVIYTNRFINSITEDLKRTLQSFNLLEKELLQLYEKMKIDGIVNKEFYESIQSRKIVRNEDFLLMFSKIRESLLSFYEIKAFAQVEQVEGKADDSDSEDLIFSKDSDEGGLCKIDLKSFKQSKLGYEKIGSEGGACKISKGLYFFNGGIKKEPIGETWLINTIKGTADALPPSICRKGNGCIYKDGQVYVFGGYQNLGIEICQTYNIAARKWEKINSLPVASFSNTATLLDNRILVTGFNLNCVFSYDTTGYTSVLKLQSNFTKFLCEGWVISNRRLYENSDRSSNKWETYHTQCVLDTYFVYTGFKRGSFIYFITVRNQLWRINTIDKKIELVNYS